MNLNYLEKVHGLPELGITHDFDTWVEGVKSNDAYLNQLHGYLKNKKGLNVDFNEWKTGIFGEAVEEPKLQKEVEKEKIEEKGEYHISEGAFKNPEKKGFFYGYEANLIGELEKKYGKDFKFEEARVGQNAIKVSPINENVEPVIFNHNEADANVFGDTHLTRENLINFLDQNKPQPQQDAGRFSTGYFENSARSVFEKSNLAPKDYIKLNVEEEKVFVPGAPTTGDPLEQEGVVSTGSMTQKKADAKQMDEMFDILSGFYEKELDSLADETPLDILKNIQEGKGDSDKTIKQLHASAKSYLKEQGYDMTDRQFANLVDKATFEKGFFRQILNKKANKESNATLAESISKSEELNPEFMQNLENMMLENYSEKELKKYEYFQNVFAVRDEIKRLEAEKPKNWEEKTKELYKEIDPDKINVFLTELATKKDILGRKKYDETLGTKYMAGDDGETTKYRQEQIEKYKQSSEARNNNELLIMKDSDPGLTDWEAHDKLYKAKAYDLSQIWAYGNNETIEIEYKGYDPEGDYTFHETKLRKGLIADGYLTKEEANKSYAKGEVKKIKIPIKQMYDWGLDGRDYKGVSNWLGFSKMSKNDTDKLLQYEASLYRTKTDLAALHELTYVNNDPASFERKGEFLRSAVTSSLTAFTDLSAEEADKIASKGPGYTTDFMLNKFQDVASDYNAAVEGEMFVDEKGNKQKVEPLIFTEKQAKAFEKSFVEEIGEGVGHFVPMLIELGILSAGVGSFLKIPKVMDSLNKMRSAGAMGKMKYHALMAMIEEGKMFTVGMGAGTGTGFYIGGVTTQGLTPFKGRWKYLDPIYQRVLKGGPVGAASSQLASNMELAIKDLMGDADFKAVFDENYSDLDKTTRDVLVESIVFSIVGASHLKGVRVVDGKIKRGTDFMTTGSKERAFDQLATKQKEITDKALKEKEKREKDTKGEQHGVYHVVSPKGRQMVFTKDQWMKMDPKGWKVVRQPSDFKMVEGKPDGYQFLTTKEKNKWDAYEQGKEVLNKSIRIDNMAIKLDPNRKDFATLDANGVLIGGNSKKLLFDPLNKAIKTVVPEHKDFKVKFTTDPREFTIKDAVAEYNHTTNTMLFNKSKYTPGKSVHEFFHAAVRARFKSNDNFQVNFNENFAKKFGEAGFNFEAFEGTKLGDWIKENYGTDGRLRTTKNLRGEEFLAYMLEIISDPKVYRQTVATSFFKESKQELLDIFEETTGIRPKMRNAKEFVEVMGRFAQAARRGLGFETKAAALAELDKYDFLGIEYVENAKQAKKDKFASKDLIAERKKLTEEQLRLNREKPEGWEKKQKENKKEIKKLTENIKRSETNIAETKKYAEAKRKQTEFEEKFAEQKRKELEELEKKKEELGEIKYDEGKAKIEEKYTDTSNRRKENIAVENLRENNRGIIENFIKDKFKEVPGGATRADFRNYVENVEFGKILETYRKRSENLKDVPFSFYLENILQGGTGFGGGRLGNILKGIGVDVTKKIKEVSRDDPGYVEPVTPTEISFVEEAAGGSVGIQLINELPVKQKTIDKITKQAEKLDLESLDYKTLKDQASEATKEMFGKTTKDKAQFIADNWKTIYDSLPLGAQKTTGKATGVENSILKDFYKKSKERVKMVETGDKAGLFVQEKLPMNKKEFLNKLGIKVLSDGKVDVSGMGRNIKTSTIPAMINQTGKAITNQIVREYIKNSPEGRFKTNSETLRNQIGSGKSEALASKLLNDFTEQFKLDLEKTRNIFIDYALGDRKNIDKKHLFFLDKYNKGEFLSSPEMGALWSAVETMGLEGKTRQIRLKTEFNNFWKDQKIELENGEIISAKEIKNLVNTKAMYSSFQGNVFVDAKRLNKHVNHSVEFSKMLPKQFEKALTFFDQSIGLHQRVTFEREGRTFKEKSGVFILDQRGRPIVDQPFTRGRERALKNLGKNVSKNWDGIIIKFKSASVQQAAQLKMNNTKIMAEKLKIAQEGFSRLDNKTKEDIHFALESTKQDYLYAAKNKAEFISRLNWVYNIAASNSNLRMGTRQLAPVKYVLFKDGIVPEGTKVKLEHLKTSVAQSIESANLIASGRFKEAGKDAIADFAGLTSTKEYLDIVDSKGGLTNTSGLYRMALLNPEVLKQFRSVDSGFKRTLFEDIMAKAKKEILGPKLKKIQQDIKTIDKQNSELLKKQGVRASKEMSPKEKIEALKTIDKALAEGKKKKKKARGMSTFDFDETLVVKGKNYITATEPVTGKKTRISSERWPIDGPKLAEQGYKFDFKDFVNVRGGVEGPLLQKMKNQIKKYGVDNVFVLTARPAESATAIKGWLKSKGIEIPIENITGLGNSTGEAKALWMLKKFSEGYNDMYFVDDALPNVKAVKRVLNQLDIKSNIQQVRASKDLNKDFNKIVSETTKIGEKEVISGARAKVLGKKGKFRSVVVSGAQDFMGLMQNFMGKGKKGDAHRKFFEDNLVEPFAKGINEMNNAKQRITEDMRAIHKELPQVKKKLNKKMPGSDFTFDQAIRVHMWDKLGFTVPELSKKEVKDLREAVRKDSELSAFANSLLRLTKNEYIKPSTHWTAETIISDLQRITQTVGRKKYLAEWIENKNIIFSKENLNKIEATQGTRFKEALEEMLFRMETGSNRPTGLGKLANAHMNFINGSVAATMFFNMRSALLQTISMTNYVNWSFNNPLKAGKAFANQKQFWKDFSMIWNSSTLKQRRAGLKYNVQEAELAAAVEGSTNKSKAAIAWLLKKGFTPTQIADSFAISAGGATYYRNAVNHYKKLGLSEKAAKEKALLDFQQTTEKAQQSSRADLISQQQASVLGRTILAWANTPMQYLRIQEKAARDIINGRGDFKTNISKIAYYGAVQSVIFAGLQSALFAFALDSEEDLDDEKKKERILRVVNTVADSQLRGAGTPGALLSAIKNTVMEWDKQEKKGYRADHTRTILQLTGYSPVIGSKLRKLYSATQTYKYNRDVIPEMGFNIDNPANLAIGNVIEATTNIPTARVVMKVDNIRESLDSRNQWWQRVAALMGWSKWDIGAENENLLEFQEDIKERKKIKRKKEREQAKKIEDAEIEKKFIEDQKKERKQGKKNVTCAAVNRSGNRCSLKPVGNSAYCTVHQKVAQGTKQVQCKKVKSDGKRCKLQTKNKSGLCYYHD